MGESLNQPSSVKDAELFYLHLQIAVFFTQDVALRRCFLAKGRKPTMVGNELPNLRLEIAYDLFLCHLSVAGNIFRLPKGI